MSSHRVQRLFVEGLRSSSPSTLVVLVQDVIRQHVDRIEPSCVADLFALAELGLPGTLGSDLTSWADRAAREIRDMPDGAERAAWVAEMGMLEPALVPQNLRAVIAGLEGQSTAMVVERIQEAAGRWSATPPAAVVLPAPRIAKAAGSVLGPAVRPPATPKVAAAPKVRAPKTPAHLVDPRRAEWIRGDAVARLASPEYAERGLKESILVAGILHRSPYKDLTTQEVMAELRKLERERRLKHTGERWTAR